MKKVIVALLAVCLCLAFTGCSESTPANPVTGYRKGDVTLGQYKGITYTPASVEVSDDEVEKSISSELKSHSEDVAVTDRPVKSGDTVNIDYVGKIDGVAFDKGSATGQNLVIGSGRMIPGFEDGIIGMENGETRTIDVTFPETYTDPEKAGKAATFDITLNSITETVIPELTEEFVKETLEYDSIEAYRASVRAELEEDAAADAESQKFSDVVNTAVDNATFNKDLADDISKTRSVIESNYDQMAQSYYNVDAKTLFQYLYGMDAEQYEETMQNQAEANTKYNYLLSAIAEAENLSATDEEVAEYAQSMLTSYGVESLEELYALIEKNSGTDAKTMLAEQVKLNKASDLIIDSAVPAE